MAGESSFRVVSVARRINRNVRIPRRWAGPRIAGTVAVSLGMILGINARPAAILPAVASVPKVHATQVHAPQMSFYIERNVGQAPGAVRYLAHAGSQIIYLTGRGDVITRTGRSLLRMSPLGGATQPQLVAADRRPGIVNYFIGSNPNRWHTNIPTYGRVVYRNIYPGIDLAFHGHGARLEYDWVVRAGADPGRIRLRFSGAGKPAIDAHGALRFGSVPILQTRPVLHQRIAGMQHLVRGGYAFAGRSTIRFRAGRYDLTRPLIIDPVLLFAEYLGGSGDDEPCCVKLDAKGNIYVAGYTSSPNFPVRNAYQRTAPGGGDMFALKLSSSGALVYSTYIGGTADDEAIGLALDGAGRAYLAGTAQSADFPLVPRATFPGGMAAAVVALNPQGNSLRYSTVYRGGRSDQAVAIAVDAQGDAYAALFENLTGKGLPTMLVMKVDRNGPSGPGTTLSDVGLNWAGTPDDIAVLKNGNVVVVGATDLANFPIYKAAQPSYGGGDLDGFVTELDPTLRNIVFSTYLGGSKDDGAYAVTADRSNNIFVTGATDSTDFPASITIDVLQGDSPFVAKFSSGGKVLHNTLIGLAADGEATAIIVNKRGYATIGGAITGNGLVMANPLRGHGVFGGGKADGFVATVGGGGQRVLFSSYLGGALYDEVEGLAMGGSGNLFATGITKSPNFPRTHGQAFNQSGQEDGFIVKIGTHR